METITITIIAVALAMDAFAVSVVSGAIYKELKIHHAFRTAGFFGFFQALMPLLGALAVTAVRDHIATFDHWIAFVLLAGVGAKMIYESFKIEPDRSCYDVSNLPIVLILAVATSIDALAVGVTLSLITDSVITAVSIIGAITFILSFAGTYIGRHFGHFFESKIEILGGVILILIGCKILMEHLFFQ